MVPVLDYSQSGTAFSSASLEFDLSGLRPPASVAQLRSLAREVTFVVHKVRHSGAAKRRREFAWRFGYAGTAALQIQSSVPRAFAVQPMRGRDFMLEPKTPLVVYPERDPESGRLRAVVHPFDFVVYGADQHDLEVGVEGALLHAWSLFARQAPGVKWPASRRALHELLKAHFRETAHGGTKVQAH